MNSENMILIPARAGTSNISRQNLHLVNDKPLIYYVIQTALKYTKNVFVSTDSEEIKQISLFYGAKVINRPKNLTKNTTSLDEIALDALTRISKNHVYEKCLILNPKYPLIQLSTIKKFFSLLNKNVQTIYGYEQIFHHQYKQINLISKDFGKIIKDFDNCVITEKIVSFNCKNFLKFQKFESPFYGLKLKNNEPLALDSYHDFGVLEKILGRRRILVRVDGSRQIGLGHVYNMLTILNRFRNDEILIVMHKEKNLGINKFREHLYKVVLFNNTFQLQNIISKFKPNMIFNDILDTSVDYIKKLKTMGIFVVNFEDLGEGRRYSDLVFNPIYNSNKVLKNEFYGPKFACVRDEFRIWNSSKIKQTTKNVLISFGGSDPTNKTTEILKIINKNNLLNLSYTVVLGIGFKNKKSTMDYISKMKSNGFKIHVLEKVDFLAKSIRDSDFAITSNGRTVFEIASIGVPLIVIPVNQRESNHNFVKNFRVGFQLNFHADSFSSDFMNSFKKIQNFKNRKFFFNNLKKLDLLDGIDRVVQIIVNNYERNRYNQ